MTTDQLPEGKEICPVQGLLKMLAGKWKLDVFRLAQDEPLRFSSLLRRLPGSNKQTLSVALRELEESGLLERIVVKPKPLHVEYVLTKRGKSLAPLLKQLEDMS